MKILRIILKAIPLVVKFSAMIPVLLYRRRKGVNSFTRELTEAGMDKEMARELAREYREYPSHFYNLIRKKAAN